MIDMSRAERFVSRIVCHSFAVGDLAKTYRSDMIVFVIGVSIVLVVRALNERPVFLKLKEDVSYVYQ